MEEKEIKLLERIKYSGQMVVGAWTVKLSPLRRWAVNEGKSCLRFTSNRQLNWGHWTFKHIIASKFLLENARSIKNQMISELKHTPLDFPLNWGSSNN